MSGRYLEPDRLVELTENVVRLARICELSLQRTVIPALQPRCRAFAGNLGKNLRHSSFFEEAFLRDLDAFVEILTREISDATRIGWEADENHVRGGWEVPYRDDRALDLASEMPKFQDLHQAISEVLDHIAAKRLAETPTMY